MCYVAKSEILSLSSDVEEVHNNRTPTTVAWKSSPPRHAADPGGPERQYFSTWGPPATGGHQVGQYSGAQFTSVGGT